MVGSTGARVRVRLLKTGTEVNLEDRTVILLSNSAHLGSATSNGTPSGRKAQEPTRRGSQRETERSGLVPRTVQPFQLAGGVQLRQAIEALRFGLVPSAALERLTVDYAALEIWTKDHLPGDRRTGPMAAEITGPFGTGKSHASAVVRHVAQGDGFLVANVEVDGVHVSHSDPGKLWHALSSTVHARGLATTTPIFDVYRGALKAGGRVLRTVRPGVDGELDSGRANFEVVRSLVDSGAENSVAHILENHLSADPGQLVSQAKVRLRDETRLPGSELGLRSVIGKSLATRAFGYVQALVALALAGQLAGYKGLVVTVDEFEVEYNQQPHKITRVRELMSELAAYMEGRGPLLPAPVALFFAAVGQGNRAGDPLVGQVVDAARGNRYELEPLRVDHRLRLAREIHSMYAETYGVRATFDAADVNRVETSLKRTGHLDSSGVGRAFIKRYVASLDLRYGPPNG